MRGIGFVGLEIGFLPTLEPTAAPARFNGPAWVDAGGAGGGGAPERGWPTANKATGRNAVRFCASAMRLRQCSPFGADDSLQNDGAPAVRDQGREEKAAFRPPFP
jgi:hypothetical protein